MNHNRRQVRGGFTLLEIILVLVIMGLIAAVLIGGSAKLLSTKPTSPDDVFKQAVTYARKRALIGESEVRLAFDEKTASFTVNDGTAPRTFAIPGAPPGLEVSFIAPQTSTTSLLLGATPSDSDKLPFATFFGDGTCSPFRVQFRSRNGAHLISIDPWTCAPVLPATNPT